MLYVNVYYAPSNSRSKVLAQAMARGIKAISNDSVSLRPSVSYKGIDSDVAVFYGLAEGLSRVMTDYSSHAKAVYMDLGYWHRRIKGKYDGYHKISVNSRHPTAYFQKLKHSPSRFKQLGLNIAPWRRNDGGHILVAGMSAKAALAEGFEPEVWERNMVRELSLRTERKIIYRPKPNWSSARPIRGSELQRKVELDQALVNCHSVVTHHSNVAVDALLAGIPTFCWHGIASVMSLNMVDHIEKPYYPEGREQFAYDAAYCQWSIDEMAQGLPWKHLKNEGLIK